MLETNNDYFEKNNMIALYGEWGSGKTSVMEYINKNITNYNVVFLRHGNMKRIQTFHYHYSK